MLFLDVDSDPKTGWLGYDFVAGRKPAGAGRAVLERHAGAGGGYEWGSPVEVESAASGLIAGRNAAALVDGRPLSTPPRTTAIGALAHYVSHASPATYQPSNITHGIMAPLERAPKDKLQKKLMIAERALADLQAWQQRQLAAVPQR